MRLYKVGLFFFLLILVSGLITAGWYLRQLEQIVTVKFEGPKWEFPSKIYSDSLFLYTGMNLRLENLIEKLRRLGYVATPKAVKTEGEYRFLRNKGTLEIYLHDFDYPSEPFEGYPVRIILRDSVITRIERMDNQETFSLELEPELVAGLFDGIWEERKLVKLDEVPPLL
jgi:penicillin-binding protein 1B